MGVDNTKVEFGKVEKQKPWGVIEPSDLGAHEDCVHTMAGGLWNDYYCGARYNYICGPASQEWCEFISEYECNDECRHSFENIKKTYPDAKDCLSSGAGPWSTRPKGCFYHTKDKCIHWNPHATGRKNNEDVQVCSNTA